MARPKSLSTVNWSSTQPFSSLWAEAARTPTPCSVSTPVTRANSRASSSAITTRSLPSPSYVQPLLVDQRLLRIRRPVVVGDLGGGASSQHVADALDEIAHQTRLPGTPCGWSGRQRVGLCQDGQELKARIRPDECGDAIDRAGVVEIPSGGDVSEQQMMGDEAHERVDVVFVEPHARADGRHDLDTGFGVVARVSLADVVQQRADHEEVRTVDAACPLAGVRRGLDEMPVDGEPVVGVALRPAADVRPLRNDARPEANLVERLDHGDGAVPGEQEVDQRSASSSRPRTRQRRSGRREQFERVPGDRDVVLGSRGGDLQWQRTDRCSHHIGGDARTRRHATRRPDVCPGRALPTALPVRGAMTGPAARCRRSSTRSSGPLPRSWPSTHPRRHGRAPRRPRLDPAT